MLSQYKLNIEKEFYIMNIYRIKAAIKSLKKAKELGLDYNPKHLIQSNFIGKVGDNPNLIVNTLKEAVAKDIGLCFAGIISRTSAFKIAGGTLRYTGYPEFGGSSGGYGAMNKYFEFDCMHLVKTTSEYATLDSLITFLESKMDKIKLA